MRVPGPPARVKTPPIPGTTVPATPPAGAPVAAGYQMKRVGGWMSEMPPVACSPGVA